VIVFLELLLNLISHGVIAKLLSQDKVLAQQQISISLTKQQQYQQEKLCNKLPTKLNQNTVKLIAVHAKLKTNNGLDIQFSLVNLLLEVKL
jgi:hypothetical protein